MPFRDDYQLPHLCDFHQLAPELSDFWTTADANANLRFADDLKEPRQSKQAKSYIASQFWRGIGRGGEALIVCRTEFWRMSALGGGRTLDGLAAFGRDMDVAAELE